MRGTLLLHCALLTLALLNSFMQNVHGQAPTFVGTNGDDSFGGGYQSDIINGGKGNDVLEGHGSSDTLYGNAGDDILNGGDGDDILNGGPGSDTLSGGEGTDTAVFSGVRGDYTIEGHVDGYGKIVVKDTRDEVIVKVVEGKKVLPFDSDGTDTVLADVEKLQFSDTTIQAINATGIYDIDGYDSMMLARRVNLGLYVLDCGALDHDKQSFAIDIMVMVAVFRVQMVPINIRCI
jgi:Ca2+-binding RTX toxin-like protein